MPLKPIFTRPPLSDAYYTQLPLTAVMPKGIFAMYLAEEAAQMESLPWTGWMLESIIPIAFLTNNEKLKAQVEEKVEELLASQKEDGSCQPLQEQWMPVSQCRGLMQYYMAVGDQRILIFLLKYIYYCYTHFGKLVGDVYEASIAGDYVSIALWLYEVTGKTFLLKFLDKLRADTLDWTSYFHTFSLTQPFTKQIPIEELQRGLLSENKATREYYEKQSQFANGVRLAMGFKVPALLARYSGSNKEKTAAILGIEKIMRYHGVPNGIFTADASLAGQNPSCGTDTRVASEMMLSLEQIVRCQGEALMVDLWEKIAFNALPAARNGSKIKKLIQVNQTNEDPYMASQREPDMDCMPEIGSWHDSLQKGTSHFAGSTWMAAPNDGLALMSYMASEVRWKVDGTLIKLSVSGEYPYDGRIEVKVNCKRPVTLPLHLRIPDWAKGANIKINQEEVIYPKPFSFYVINREWNDGDIVYIDFPMAPRITQWYHRGLAVEYGPLLMALPIYCDRDSWNMGLVASEPMNASIERTEDKILLKVEVSMRKVPQWEMKGKAPAAPPVLPESSEPIERKILVPYAETMCRIAQFPKVKEESDDESKYTPFADGWHY